MIALASAEAIAACAAASAFCFGISLVPGRNPIVARLNQLEEIAKHSQSDRLQRLAELVGEERRSRLRDRLNHAGWYDVSPAAFVMRGIAGIGAGIAISIALYAVLPGKPLALLLGLVVTALAWRSPKIALDRAIAARRDRVARELPDFLDVLAATVRAGLALNGALLYATEVTAGPLHDELRATLDEIRLGRPRADALQAMAQRINESQTSVTITSIVQAERLGANLAAILHEVAVDTRNRRWMIAEERAAKIPIKMILPMGLLMLPALYIVIFTPVVARYFGR